MFVYTCFFHSNVSDSVVPMFFRFFQPFFHLKIVTLNFLLN
jgi:hypothetical protein